MEQVDVVLPAGGRASDELAALTGAASKTLIRINDRTILESVIRALRETGRVRRIAVSGPPPVLSEARRAGADGLLAEGATGPENNLRCFLWLREQRHPAPYALIATSDLPFLSSNGVSALIDSCIPDVDIGVPVLRHADFAARFPGANKFSLSLQDGVYTAGCVIWVKPSVVASDGLRRHWKRVEQVFDSRASQLALARMLGPLNLARFLTGRLGFVHMERHCGRLLGCAPAAIHDSAPELAFDIDKPEDYHYALHVTRSAAMAPIAPGWRLPEQRPSTGDRASEPLGFGDRRVGNI